MTAIEILRECIENDKAVVEHYHSKLLQIVDVDEQREYIYEIEEYNATIKDCEKAVEILEDYDDE